MRIKDAIASLQLTRKKHTDITQLSTPWSEPGPDGKPIDGPDYVPLPEYPRPRLRRNDWINLNGWWDYRILRPGSGKKSAGGRILVPFSPETARSGMGITLLPGETFAYRRKVKLPLLPEGKLPDRLKPRQLRNMKRQSSLTAAQHHLRIQSTPAAA